LIAISTGSMSPSRPSFPPSRLGPSAYMYATATATSKRRGNAPGVQNITDRTSRAHRTAHDSEHTPPASEKLRTPQKTPLNGAMEPFNMASYWNMMANQSADAVNLAYTAANRVSPNDNPPVASRPNETQIKREMIPLAVCGVCNTPMAVAAAGRLLGCNLRLASQTKAKPRRPATARKDALDIENGDLQVMQAP